MNTKLTKYLASAGALLGVVTQGNASIIYTDLDPDHENYSALLGSVSLDSYALDLDNNSTPDFQIAQIVGNGLAILRVDAIDSYYANSNAIIKGSAWASALSLSSSIGASDNWISTYSSNFMAMINTVYSFSGGYWLNVQNKFLGLRFNIVNQTHYGWARLSVDLDSSYYVLKDYAYETVPDSPIKAGQIENGFVSNIEINLESKFEIYTNQNQVFIKSDLSNYEVVVSDILGKQILSRTDNSGNSNFPISEKGVYIVTLILKGEMSSKKVVI